MHQSQILSTLEDDPLWYKDAVIYEVNVRAFADRNGDGIGDFRGLTEKLDYLHDLGVTAIWLLPFSPSPEKDDGYDITDFRDVHPAYGTLRDFQTFVKEAHRLGLRVITELVLNHTSDQHSWFQRSRTAPSGSAWRNFYVWSDDPTKYADTRIIFKDSEQSNWTWDPVARSYYWHRFYSHQPDLNFDNAVVRRTVKRTLDFWAELGVDGFCLDAIPYLFEREGTNCENLPETHTFLQELRQHLDVHYPNRVLLGEANLWPEDAVAYFGSGDECHMSFHFPLMPRLFMALRLEDRLPVVEIMKRTPAVAETCQWALFLRNHTELTLEMVADEERDYMFRIYTADGNTRSNLSLRRRLAPLLGNDRPRIEVMNALLLSLPGTPIIYYGDEIGMGDNVYLGDRKAVRTPMQWSPDRNAGFSVANPQRLYLPVTIDPAYHYEAINVEAQQGNPHSLLNWTKRMVALRKQYKAFGRGTLEFLTPANGRVLVFIRRYQTEVILVVANLSRFAQPVDLDLHRFRGYTPVELLGRTDFPTISDAPYSMTLGPHAFFWFTLEARMAPALTGSLGMLSSSFDLPVVQVVRLINLWDSNNRASLAAAFRRFLPTASWFVGGERRFRGAEIIDLITVTPNRFTLVLLRVEYTAGEPQTYLVAVGIARGDEAQLIREENGRALMAEVRAADGSRAFLYDAIIEPAFATALLDVFLRRRRLQGETGVLAGERNRQLRRPLAASPADIEPVLDRTGAGTSTVHFGQQLTLQLLRNVESGAHPAVEMGELLSEPRSPATAAIYAGSLQWKSNADEETTLGVVHGFVPNEGTAWSQARAELNAFFARVLPLESRREQIEQSAPGNVYHLEFALAEPPPFVTGAIGSYLEKAFLLGTRTGDLHRRLTQSASGKEFTPEPYSDFYRQNLYHGWLQLTSRSFEFLRQRFADTSHTVQRLALAVLNEEDAVNASFRSLYTHRVQSLRSRFHGRLSLDHFLVTTDDFVIIDFGGEAGASLSERRSKRSPIRDVANMLLSFGYVTQSSMLRQLSGERADAAVWQPLRIWGRFWCAHVSAAFLRGYWKAIGSRSYLPASLVDSQILLDTHLLERSLLDIRTTLNEKPELAALPLRVILHLVAGETERNIS